VLDIVVQQNIRVSDVIVSDILDSGHLPTLFHILDHVKIRNLSEHVEKLTDWERSQSLTSELISPKTEISLEYKPIKRRVSLQPLLFRRIGCRQIRLHFRISTTIFLV
jgi:hypothetical protein